MNKKAFTLVELLAIIGIIAILLLLLVPSVTRVSTSSKKSIQDSKIKVIESAAEKYGNKEINDYQKCVGTLDSTQVTKCTVSIEELIENGYLSGDKNDVCSGPCIINPVTNNKFLGKVLICYNPSKVNINTKYIENDDEASCEEITLSGNASLNLSSVKGNGYVGGKDIEVKIITSGNIDKVTCTSSDSTAAEVTSCTKNKMTIKVGTIEGDSKTVEITVKASVPGEQDLIKTYTLNVMETEFSIDNSNNNVCIESGSKKEIDVTATNVGKVKIDDTQSNGVISAYKNNKINLSVGTNLGESKIKFTEVNTGKTIELINYVYKLNLKDKIPNNMIIGKDVDIEIDHGGLDNLILTSSDNEVVEVNSNGQNSFKIRAKKIGEATLTIKGEKDISGQKIDCGLIQKNIAVKNLSLDSNTGNVYVGGEPLKIQIDSDDKNLTCESTSSAATCTIDANTLIITGNAAANDVIITVTNSSGGSDSIKVNVLKSSLELIGNGNRALNNGTVCRDINSNSNDETITINSTDLSKVSVKDSAINDYDWWLSDVSINGDKVVVNPRDLDLRTVCSDGSTTCSTVFKAGRNNTGRAKVFLTESAGNNEAQFTYDIYSLTLPKTSETVKVNESAELTITSSATGELNARVEDETLASVSITRNNSTYNDNINGVNEYILRITGIKKGNTKIIISGTDCGNKSINLEVKDNKFTVKFSPGANTQRVSVSEATCTITDNSSSCEVNLPSITAKTGYTALGFSTNSSSRTAEITGSKLTLTNDNNGTEYFGISYDNTKPICEFEDVTSKIQVGDTPEIKLTCTDYGSGINNSTNLTASSISISDSNIGQITSVSSPTSISNGYSYKVKLNIKSYGIFKLTLKPNILRDGANLENDEVTSNNISSLEHEAVEVWQVGKVNRPDVIAALYDNKYINNGTPGTYTLKFYGTGDMLDFTSYTSTGGGWRYGPWYNNYRNAITKVEVSSGVTSLGDYALYESPFTTLTLSNSVKSIGNYAFYTNKLSSLAIPASVEKIGDYAFYQYANRTLTSLTFASGSNLKTIGNYAFHYHKISSLSIPPSVETIGNYAFYEPYETDSNGNPTGFVLSSLSFGTNSKLKTIGTSAFAYNKISSLTIPASVEIIGNSAFQQIYDSNYLRTLTFEDNSQLKRIEAFAFYGNKISSLTFPSYIEYIGNDSFISGAYSITSLNFSKATSLKIIGSFAFDNTTASNISLPNSVEEIGSFAFGSRAVTSSFKIGPNVKVVGDRIIAGEYFSAYTIDPNNPYYTVNNGVLYSKDMTTLVNCPSSYARDGHSSFIIPETVTKLSYEAFGGWLVTGSSSNERMSVTLPKNLAPENANLPSNFHWYNITYLYVNSENPYFASDNGVLYNKDYTTAYVLPSDYLGSTSYSLKNTTKFIAANFGFAQMRVSTVTIPVSVTDIDYGAFSSQPSYGYRNVYLNVDTSTNISSGAFELYKLYWDYSGTQVRNIYVKSQELKTKLENTLSKPDPNYFNARYNIVVQ